MKSAAFIWCTVVNFRMQMNHILFEKVFVLLTCFLSLNILPLKKMFKKNVLEYVS